MHNQTPDTAPDYYIGQPKVRFRYGSAMGGLILDPKTFTPTTELGRNPKPSLPLTSAMSKCWRISVDARRPALAEEDIENSTQGHSVNFPNARPIDRKVSDLYGMIRSYRNCTCSYFD